MTNNIIKLILSGALMHGAATQCASAEEMHAMAANEAHATVFLEKVQATFTNIRQKACQQKDFIINIINSQNQLAEAVAHAANAEFIQANDVVKQATLEKIKNAALMLLRTIHQGEGRLADLEEKMLLLQEAGGVHPDIYDQLFNIYYNTKQELARGQIFAQEVLENQAQEAAEIAALQAGARQALEAAQQAPNQQIGAMRREVEIHQAVADAADHARQEAADALEVADVIDQAPVVAQVAADRWLDIMQAANMDLIAENIMQIGAELINALRNGDIYKISEILEEKSKNLAKIKNNAIAPAEFIEKLVLAHKQEKNWMLFQACDHRQINIIHLLLRAGADINYLNHNGYTCLIAAARAGHTNVVKHLVEAGANKIIQNHYGDTALIAAAQAGHYKTVAILLQAGPNEIDLDLQNVTRNAALHMAVKYGLYKVVKKLIKAGADIEAPNGNGRTPLILAAKYNLPEIIKILLHEGANTQVIDDDGLRAFDYASNNGNLDILALPNFD